MSDLILDTETFSRCNLKTSGLYRYAEDDSTDLLCVCWAFDEGPVSAWIPSAGDDFNPEEIDGAIYRGPTAPTELSAHIAGGGIIRGWNVAFERQVLNGSAGQRYGLPKISIEQTRCSMARSRYSGLPGALENAAEALNAPNKKRIIAINAMRYLCKPRADGSRPTIAEARDRFMQLVPYCADDVRAERAIDAMLPEMSPKEIQVYHFDQRVNDRGVKVDLAGVADMEYLIDAYKQQLKNRCMDRTDCSPSRPAALGAWIRANGYPELENLQADTVRHLVEKPEVPEAVKEVLKLYSTYNMKAVSKYAAIPKAVCKDGRLRGMLQYHVAGTGRWSSFIVQLHNMFRPVIDDPETAVEAAKARDLDWLRTLYPGVDPMKVIASCVRSMFIADEGKELVFPDFSGIEARGNSWLWQETWKLEAYMRDEDLYVQTYARAFGVDSAGVTKSQRHLGKALELAMGYGGGVGAFIKSCASQRIPLAEVVKAQIPDDVRHEAIENYDFALSQGRGRDLTAEVWCACEGLKLLWRRAHPRIVAGWKQLEDAAVLAGANPGRVYEVAGGKIKFKVKDQWLCMSLPSKRLMRYFQPIIRDGKLYYQGTDTVTRQWGLTSTYGGKLCENAIQALCRDLLVDAMLAFDAASHDIVLHVHDEPAMEVPIGSLPDAEVIRIMCQVPEWAKGFPLAIEMHRGRRYRK
jgi:DNA polymerase